jgi:hypothetical protein
VNSIECFEAECIRLEGNTGKDTPTVRFYVTTGEENFGKGTKAKEKGEQPTFSTAKVVTSQVHA